MNCYVSKLETTMTPAEAKNLRSMKGKFVQIKWRNPDHDWPYYRLLAVDAKASTIKVRGMDYPAQFGGYKHDGDEFHADWSEVNEIEPVMVRV